MHNLRYALRTLIKIPASPAGGRHRR